MTGFKKITLALAFLALPFTAQAQECDRDCLVDITDQYLAAMLARDWSGLPWAEQVRFTENNVSMMIGDGLWGTATAYHDGGFYVTDEDEGGVLWFGVVEEHGQPSYLTLRLKVDGRAISEVETVLGREQEPIEFAAIDGYTVDPVFAEPVDKRMSRRRMVSLVDDFYDSKLRDDGRVQGAIADDCTRIVNGESTTHGDHADAQMAEGCRQQIEAGLFKQVEAYRDRRYPIVDRERGIVIAVVQEDIPSREAVFTDAEGREYRPAIEHPNTRGMIEMFKIEDGEIVHVESVSVFLPYYMPDSWS